MSNVDIANEFSDMIITQRGFQSNSKIITVGDEMLETVINMKR
jgi:flagellar hook protein FlgE